MTPTMHALIAEKKIIVCCGAGGVGKTTASASIALAGAKLGRRVLVLTIDPSRRLAEALGVARNPTEPVAVPAERLAAVGVTGEVHAWMLDPKLVSDRAVGRIISDPVLAEKFLNNRIYRHVTSMVATMQEYTAMEALHRFVLEDRYDLIVLDTPPSRHALDFLEAPGRVARFLEGRIFRLFLPKEGGIIRRATSSLMSRVLGAVFGQEFAGDLSEFLGSFAGIFALLGHSVSSMRTFLSAPEVAFLLVASPSPASLKEAYFFLDKTRELELPFRGFILNRSLVHSLTLPEAPDMKKLRELAELERAQARDHEAILEDLRRRADATALTMALPSLSGTSDTMKQLGALTEALLANR